MTAASILLVILLVIVGALVIAALWGVGIYNGLVGLRNACKNAFAQVDVQLKRRYDLIPNLVETAKGYMAHESGTLTAVVEARAKATQANVRFAGEVFPQVFIANAFGFQAGEFFKIEDEAEKAAPKVKF